MDKAKTLLWPIKEKYGLGLSWGDLIILAGTSAIESMGGPWLGFCGGRIDDADGSWSAALGPWEDQPLPCEGDCGLPFGSTTIGLIYVNPEGPQGVPDPAGSAVQVRDTFNRMNMNDSETVALIGGGHAFGKTHGACPLGPGASPLVDPVNPWQGRCGNGRGNNTYTSGFEGPWSTTPLQWGNSYFTSLKHFNWTVALGPGNKSQWHTASDSTIMMLTTDIALKTDPRYAELVELFAGSLESLGEAFKHAWYKLTTRDMGPWVRCAGPWVPPPQPFQFPLPAAPAKLSDFERVKAAIRPLLFQGSSLLVPDTLANGTPYYGALFVHMAWQCASSFRLSDYQGGCSGARIRFPPQSKYPANIRIASYLALLQPVYDEFAVSDLSWSDLIVLAGTVALEEAAAATGAVAAPLSFCGGRTDVPSYDGGADNLKPNGNGSASVADMYESMLMAGLTAREWVALSGRVRSAFQLHAMGYAERSWTADPEHLSNLYFTTLLTETWQPVSVNGTTQYKAADKDIYMLETDLHLRTEASLLAIVQDFASNNTVFLAEFAAAWTKVMNNDRFSGPASNLCTPSPSPPTPPPSPSPPAPSPSSSAGANIYVVSVISVLITALVMGVIFYFHTRRQRMNLDGSDGKQPFFGLN